MKNDELGYDSLNKIISSIVFLIAGTSSSHISMSIFFVRFGISIILFACLSIIFSNIFLTTLAFPNPLCLFS